MCINELRFTTRTLGAPAGRLSAVAVIVPRRRKVKSEGPTTLMPKSCAIRSAHERPATALRKGRTVLHLDALLCETIRRGSNPRIVDKDVKLLLLRGEFFSSLFNGFQVGQVAMNVGDSLHQRFVFRLDSIERRLRPLLRASKEVDLGSVSR